MRVFGRSGALCSVLLAACVMGAEPPEPGGIYALPDSAGYRVAKVLLVDSGIVHVRLYADHFDALPRDLQPDSLRLGKMGDPGGVGIGHLPIRAAEFATWQPVLLTRTLVRDEELEGYHVWRENGGGVW